MKNLSKIKDGVLIIVLLFIAWKGNELFNTEPIVNTVEKVVYKDVEVPIVKTVSNNIIRTKDTVIYITQIIKDTVVVHDTINVDVSSMIFANTVDLDSLGYVDAKHILTGDELKSYYTPYLKMRERVTEVSKTIVKNNNYISGGLRYDGSVQIGVDVLNKNIVYGLDYDPLRKNIGARVGYVFFKY
jgi:hypothetical protein